MEPARYLQLLRADSDRLIEVARDRLDPAVPSCPGWTLRDLVEHLAEVYAHKVACTRELRQPSPWPPEPPAGDPVDWLERNRDELLAQLEERGPAAPSFTWFPPDQTVGFWYRRMAQETAVHRVDAEQAVGEHGPIPDDLAVDGVDEVLHVMVAGDWSEEPQPGRTRQVRVAGGDRAWLVELAPVEVTVTDEPAGAGPADLAAPPAQLLLWLWGRVPFEAVRPAGDADAVAALRARLAVATQ